MTRGLELDAGPALIALVVVAFCGACVMSALAWKRSAYSRAILALEVLRLVLVAGVGFALLRPEWVRLDQGSDKPLVAILWDDTPSMTTRDVPVGEALGGGAISRAEWLETSWGLADWSRTDPLPGSLVAALGGRYELSASPLSAATSAAEDAEPGTDLAGPLKALLGRRNLRAVVLVSDGDWNDGVHPRDVALRYRLRDIPILTSCVGSPVELPDVSVWQVDSPTFAVLGKPLSLPYTVRSSMTRDLSLTVSLTGAGVHAIDELTVPAGQAATGGLEWTPTQPGKVELTVSLPRQPGELNEANNSQSLEIDVREESLRVLLIESYPRWEYRYLRNALVRDPGVEVGCLLFHPDLRDVGAGPHYIASFPTREQLATYDVVFLGDVGIAADMLSLEDCGELRGLIEQQASGLILMPGMGGRQLSLRDSELADLMPVELDPASPRGHGSALKASLLLTPKGRTSSLTGIAREGEDDSLLWESLPGFQWYAPVMKAVAGADVLAVHSERENRYGRVPLLVTKTSGTGKVLFMGTDGAWRWREGFEDLYHYRFWGQVIRWMAYQRQMNAGDLLRLYFSPDRPQLRSEVTLFANAMDSSGSPLRQATLTARIKAPSGQRSIASFQAAEGDWGLYSSSFRPNEPGVHTLTLSCAETSEVLEAEIEVMGRPRERIGAAARPEVLEELARVTRGSALSDIEPERLGQYLRELPEPAPRVRRLRLWSHPAFGGALMLLMSLLWIGRKAVGRI